MNSPILQQGVFEQADTSVATERVTQLSTLRLGKVLVQENEPAYSKKTLVLVVMLHLLALVQVLRQVHLEPQPLALVEPMMVSLISTPQAEMHDTPNVIENAPVMAKALPTSKPVEKAQKTTQIKSEPLKTTEAPAEQVEPASLKATQNESKAEAAPEKPAEAGATAVASKSATPSEEKKPEAASNEVIEPPRFGVAYLNNPAPEYPALSRRSGEEGRVLMKVLVSTDGAAETVQIEKSSGSERLDQAAMNAVKRWRFIPAQKNKQPLSAYVLVPMKFALNS
jgi:protein TonB